MEPREGCGRAAQGASTRWCWALPDHRHSHRGRAVCEIAGCHRSLQVQILNTGVWWYSRHPNYVGEQLWWWGLALLGVQSGVWWVVVGPAFNSMVMASVTVMTERRMGARPERAKAWREYAEVTPAWVPIPTPWSACMHSRSGRRHKRED